MNKEWPEYWPSGKPVVESIKLKFKEYMREEEIKG